MPFSKFPCFLGIVKKIDSFTAEAYSHLSNHKGSKVQVGGFVAIIPGVEVGHNSDFPTVSTPALRGSQIHEFSYQPFQLPRDQLNLSGEFSEGFTIF